MLLKNEHFSNALNIGEGNGNFFIVLLINKVAGICTYVDISDVMIQLARKKIINNFPEKMVNLNLVVVLLIAFHLMRNMT